MSLVILLLVSIIPYDNVVVDEVDVTEINHFHDENGRLVFDQIILYRWSYRDSRHYVVAWRMLKTSAQVPRYDVRRKMYVATWHDTQDGDVLRRVISKSVRVTFTQHDPELSERQFLPKEKRCGLRRY